MLELSHVNIELFGQRIIHDLSFSAQKGDIIGLIGVNGAGKTTCIKSICGILEPKSGTITIDGQNIVKSRQIIQKKIGILLEGAPIYGDMKPKEFLEFIGNSYGIYGDSLKNAIIKAAEITNIQGVFHQNIDTLSKGFKRRVALAGAILHNPEILILDEPTDGLDPKQRAQALANIAQIGKARIVILSTHILADIVDICNRIILLENGRKIADMDIKEFQGKGANIENAFLQLTGANDETR